VVAVVVVEVLLAMQELQETPAVQLTQLPIIVKL
jgi:hypothetical protein